MANYIIENITTGHVFGAYEGRNSADAIRAMIRDSGGDQNETDELKASDIRYISGRAAIRYTKALVSLGERAHLVKAADPTEGERLVSYDDAEDICAEDPSLIGLRVS